MSKTYWTPELGYGFRTINCPRCKVEHETYIHSHHHYNDLRCDECSIVDLEPGQKAILHKSDGTKIEGVIAEYDDDLCGDGCCQGYRFKGQKTFEWKTDVEGIYEP